MIDDNAAPIPQSGVDFSSLSPSPTPEQYFLLSRLDGSLTVGELCKISGLGRQKTLAALESLATAGAIEIPGFEPRPSLSQADASSVAETAEARPSAKKKREQSSSKASPASKKRAQSKKGDKSKKSDKSKKKTVTPNYPTPIDQFDFDERLLSLEVPLDDDHRRELVCLHEQLDQMTFYDIFGLESDAAKKEIKKAYFRMSKRYHPDKFFRKEMDAFGPMLETVFKEITKAYRTLSSKRKRKEYDAELAAQSRQAVSSNQGVPAGQSNPPNNRGGATKATSGPVGGRDSDPAEQNKRKAAAVLLMRRAEKLEKQGRFEQAAAEYRKALALNRDANLAVRVARLLLDEAGLARESSSFARAALKLGADEASARFMLGRAKEALGADAAAIKEYRQVLMASADHAGAKARLEELGDEP